MIAQRCTSSHNAVPLRTTSHDALCPWLQQFPWQWFGTFTFEFPQSQQSASSKLQEYYFELKRFAYRKPAMFWVSERGPEGDRVHLHSLIQARDVRQERVASLWDYGRAVVRQYSGGGAVSYCCKDIGRESEWGIIGTPKA